MNSCLFFPGDPLDNRYVYLARSDRHPIAGEGSRAKVDVPPLTFYSTYNGFMWDKALAEKHNKRIDEELEAKNATERHHPDKLASWMYRCVQIYGDIGILSIAIKRAKIFFPRHSIRQCGITLDLPGKYGDTDFYRASLGHKTNHEFDPNSVFVHLDSPRYGIIIALATKGKAVKKGEEFSVAYGYHLGVDLPWYQEEYKKFAREHPEMVDAEFLKTLNSDGEKGIGSGKEEEEEEEGKKEEKEEENQM